MLKYTNKKSIDLQDWDNLVRTTYGKPYSFQQQEGCRDRGVHHFTVPGEDADEEMNDTIPEKVNGEEMGVKFNVWLSRDPKETTMGLPDWGIRMFWERNFYPDFQTVANDLYSKGLIEAGEYSLEINW